ncbi:MAG: hypothetical protein ACR2NZ_21060 [Rubripirellula sp.]
MTCIPPSCGEVGAGGGAVLVGAGFPKAEGAVLPKAEGAGLPKADGAGLPKAEGAVGATAFAPVAELGAKLLLPKPAWVDGFATFDPVSVQPAAWTPDPTGAGPGTAPNWPGVVGAMLA